MTALFQKPKIERPAAPPTMDDARANLDIRKQLAGRKGRASNIIAGGMGEGGGSATGPASKILLGQ